MKKVPAWHDKPYGKDPAAWWEAVEQARCVLMGWARREKVDTYGKLVPDITAVEWPDGPHTHQGSQIGYLLGHVSLGEWEEGRPLLSALVVAADSGMPSDGYFKLLKELGLPAGSNEISRQRIWLEEVKRIHAYWRSHQ